MDARILISNKVDIIFTCFYAHTFQYLIDSTLTELYMFIC